MPKLGYPIHPGEHAYNIAVELSSINFAGNIVPTNLFLNLSLDRNRRPNVNAIVILAEIVYWSRPIPYESANGVSPTFRKKYAGDLLQLNYGHFVDKFGFTKLQVKCAFKYLAQKELIWTEFRTVIMKGGRRANNVMFIGLKAEKLRAITNAPYGTESGELDKSSSSANGAETCYLDDSVTIAVQPDTNINTKTTLKTIKENNEIVFVETDPTIFHNSDQELNPRSIQQEMVQALGRVLVEDPELNLSRFRKFARDLIKTGYSPAQLETWFTHPDRFDSVVNTYGSDVVNDIPNPSWYFEHHWAFVRNDPSEYPTENGMCQAL